MLKLGSLKIERSAEAAANPRAADEQVGHALVLTLVLTGCLLLPTASAHGASKKPDLLIVTLDTTRADRLGCYGWPTTATATVDRMSRQGVLFSSCRSSVPITLPSHAVILTGRYPFRFSVHGNGRDRLPASVKTLAESFARAGYQTSARIGAAVLDKTFGLDQGFLSYDDDVRIGRKEAFQYAERAASQVVFPLLDRLPREPFMLFVHLYDPHAPYVSPHPFAEGYSDYMGELAFVDWVLGLLDRKLGAELKSPLLTLVAGDHGEALSGHGEEDHGIFIYEEVMHVPLIARFEGVLPADDLVVAPVGLVDVASTVRDLLDLPVVPGDGRSLLPLVQGGTLEARPLYQETLFPARRHGWSPLYGIRGDRFHYIRAPTPELYDTLADPGEFVNLARSLPGEVKRLSARLDAYPYGGGVSVDAAVDPELKRRIESLGYVDGPAVSSRIDPKAGIAVLPLFRSAKDLLDEGKAAEALAQARRALAVSPKDLLVYSLIGRCLMALRRPGEAVAVYENALKLGRYPFLLEQLGEALAVSGRLEEAVSRLGEAIDLNPRMASAYVTLANLETARGRSKQAARLFDKALKLGVRDPNLFFGRGRLAAASGDLAGALSFFDEALRQNPDMAEAFEGRGKALYQLGRADEALAAYLQALVRSPGNAALARTVGSLYLFARHEPEEAIRYFRLALKWEPNGPEANDLRELLRDLEKRGAK